MPGPRILVCGDVLGKFEILFKRCETLNKSKAGPFDFILVAGVFFADDGSSDLASVITSLNTAPLPVYFTDASGAPAGLFDVPPNVIWPMVLEKAPSVNWLGSGGVVMVGSLTIAFLSPSKDIEVDLKRLEELCSKGVYMGADILLTPEWPSGLASTLPAEGAHSSLTGLGVHIDGVGTQSAATAANLSRPRYHFSSAEGVFFQRAPYRCRADAGSAIASSRQSCVTRFISLGAVEPGKTAKERKWLHALALEPIPYMSVAALQEEPIGTTDSPFQLNTSHAGKVMGVREPQVPEDRADTGVYFYGENKQGGMDQQKRRRKNDDDGDDDDNDTLFLGPIAPGTDNGSLRAQLCAAIPGIDAVLTNVRVPVGKSFGFASFASHESAKEAMYALEGTFVNAKWGRQREDKADGGLKPPLPPGPPPKKPHHQSEEESNTLFLGFPSPLPVVGNSPAETAELLQIELKRALTAALPCLAGGLGDSSISVRALPGKAFAFLEFCDHKTAAASLDSFQGLSLEFSLGEGYGDTIPVTAKWGKKKVVPNQRYEADNRVDCWFCLASATCEAHLVTSIANDMYLCLPKGQLCDGHVLALPVPHAANHSQLTDSAQSELLAYKQALAKCFFTSFGGCGMVVFERLADTRGTYHMHQQVVPVAASLVGAAAKAFERSGKRQGLDLVLLTSDVDMKDIGEDFYFYVEIWAPGSVAAVGPTTRLLHRAQNARIPVQFGREVLANLLGCPDRSFWKTCEVSKKEEECAAEAFKATFASFDPFLG